MTRQEQERIEQVVRKIITIVPRENGTYSRWGVHINNKISIHQSEEAAVIEREAYVEWITSMLRRELAQERRRLRRMIEAQPSFDIVDEGNNEEWILRSELLTSLKGG